jgi:polysaccharide deacetylase family protein (PEP-CTERM system associated)
MDSVKNQFSLSIDWEDFGQLLCRDHLGIITPPLDAIVRQTEIILGMLERHEAKATFFVLGLLAKDRPDLVKRIAADGHEVALHGMNHIALTKLDREETRADIEESLDIVQQVSGEKVYGFRAPYFSINESNLFALEVLSELGLQYDSSIFPIRMRRYGIAGFETTPQVYALPNKKEIVELPLTVSKLAGRRMPVCGGGYMRLLPLWVLRRLFKRLESVPMIAPIIYMHPYEFDTTPINCTSNYPEDVEPLPSYKTALLNLKWNLLRQSIREKIDFFLNEYSFVTCKSKADHVKSSTQCPTILG